MRHVNTKKHLLTAILVTALTSFSSSVSFADADNAITTNKDHFKAIDAYNARIQLLKKQKEKLALEKDIKDLENEMNEVGMPEPPQGFASEAIQPVLPQQVLGSMQNGMATSEAKEEDQGPKVIKIRISGDRKTAYLKTAKDLLIVSPGDVVPGVGTVKSIKFPNVQLVTKKGERINLPLSLSLLETDGSDDETIDLFEAGEPTQDATSFQPVMN